MREHKKAFYFCPRCKSVNIWELDSHIYCPICLLTFKKESIQQFLEDVLSVEEKKLLLHAFKAEGIETKKLFKFLSE